MRVASQLTFCSPQKVLRRTVIEQDELNRITAIFGLDESSEESAHTLFYDGILSAEIISISQSANQTDLTGELSGYEYINLSESLPTNIVRRTEKPLILDFGTNVIDKINSKLFNLIPLLETYSVLEIIAACSYYPAIVCGINPDLTENRKTDLLLWENVDLVNKRMTQKTRIRIIG
ncbi:MAG: hypothetical protein PHR83_15525 [Paludibacter sp.]|nr:hypothetical protein [Paludibacter sp.]